VYVYIAFRNVVQPVWAFHCHCAFILYLAFWCFLAFLGLVFSTHDSLAILKG